MPVLGRCSTCGYTHYALFGKRCKHLDNLNQELTLSQEPGESEQRGAILNQVDNMACVAGSGFKDRNDEAYLDWLEQQYTQHVGAAADIKQDKDALREIIHRLDKLEADKPAGAGAQSAYTGFAPGKPQPTAADFNSLSDSINHLSLAMDHDHGATKKGMELRPEFHVQVLAKGSNIKSMNPIALRSEELLYGMLCVYIHMLENCLESKGYLAHMKFIARHIMEKNFTTAACVKYDRHVVDEVISGKTKFADFNPVAAGIFLHGGAVPSRENRDFRTGVDRVNRTIFSAPRFNTEQQVNRMRECNRDNVPLYMPDNWPNEICFNYNAKSCVGRCSKLHSCSFCKLRHRFADCKFALKDLQDKGFQSYQQPGASQW